MEEIASAKVQGHAWPDVGSASKGRSGASEWLEGRFEQKRPRHAGHGNELGLYSECNGKAMTAVNRGGTGSELHIQKLIQASVRKMALEDEEGPVRR